MPRDYAYDNNGNIVPIDTNCSVSGCKSNSKNGCKGRCGSKKVITAKKVFNGNSIIVEPYIMDSGEWNFRLKYLNGKILGHHYNSKENMVKSLKSIDTAMVVVDWTKLKD